MVVLCDYLKVISPKKFTVTIAAGVASSSKRRFCSFAQRGRWGVTIAVGVIEVVLFTRPFYPIPLDFGNLWWNSPTRGAKKDDAQTQQKLAARVAASF